MLSLLCPIFIFIGKYSIFTFDVIKSDALMHLEKFRQHIFDVFI